MNFFENSVMLIGDFQYTTHDVNKPLHRVALCDVTTGSCQSMGSGIVDPITTITGITQWGGSIQYCCLLWLTITDAVVSYIAANTYKVIMWNGSTWTSILSILSKLYITNLIVSK
jgi:hypothetical protein